MEESIVLIHSALAVILLLYLLVRLTLSLFVWSDKERAKRLRRKLRKADWGFAGLLLVSGLYPLLLLGHFELYHLLKLLVLILFVWLSRYARKFKLAGATLVTVILVLYAGYASFTDSPVFPKGAGAFEQNYPETANLSSLEKGELIFTTLCISCHGTDGKLGRFGAADLTQSRLTLDQKLEIISHGSPLTVMRSFSSELSEVEIKAVAHFVHRLSE